MEGANKAHHQNRKGQIRLNHKLFTNQFEHCLKQGWPNASNPIRAALSFIKKVHLKK